MVLVTFLHLVTALFNTFTVYLRTMDGFTYWEVQKNFSIAKCFSPLRWISSGNIFLFF